MKDELSNKIICQEAGSGMCNSQICKENKHKKINSTESRNGGETENQRQSMANRNKNHITGVISNILI